MGKLTRDDALQALRETLDHDLRRPYMDLLIDQILAIQERTARECRTLAVGEWGDSYVQSELRGRAVVGQLIEEAFSLDAPEEQEPEPAPVHVLERCDTCEYFADPSSPWVNLCRFNPKPIRRNGSDWCGQWEPKTP